MCIIAGELPVDGRVIVVPGTLPRINLRSERRYVRMLTGFGEYQSVVTDDGEQEKLQHLGKELQILKIDGVVISLCSVRL